MSNKLKNTVPEFGRSHIDFDLLKGPCYVIAADINDPVHIFNEPDFVFVVASASQADYIDPGKRKGLFGAFDKGRNVFAHQAASAYKAMFPNR
jgi:hypothetical protein